MSQYELVHWRDEGVGGFVCESGYLAGHGGSQHFTDVPGATLKGPKYALQRALTTTHFVERAQALGMKVYLGFYLSNYYNTATPLDNWFDAQKWRDLSAEMTRLATIARQFGFAGLAFDEEMYPEEGGVRTATWRWNYPGHDRPESVIRAKVQQRGRQLMAAILRGFPGVQIAAYDAVFPDTWHDYVQRRDNGVVAATKKSVQINFWAGLTSAPGYSALRLYNADFYKSTQGGVNWDTALRYEYTHLASELSQNIPDWADVSQRFFESPFSWIDGNVAADGSFAAPRTPGYVDKQLQAFRRWGMGGEFANYAIARLSSFNYGPYLFALRRASQDSPIPASPPTLRVSGQPQVVDCRASITGTASDDYAVWSVGWDVDGRQGSAPLTPASDAVNPGPVSTVDWAAHGIRLQPGRNLVTITARDIKGLTRTATFHAHC
jgi:hypothetical protein